MRGPRHPMGRARSKATSYSRVMPLCPFFPTSSFKAPARASLTHPQPSATRLLPRDDDYCCARSSASLAFSPRGEGARRADEGLLSTPRPPPLLGLRSDRALQTQCGAPIRRFAPPSPTRGEGSRCPPMTRPLRLLIGFASWLLTVAITLVGLASLTFFIGRVLPIDPVLAIVGEKALPEVYDRVYLELGLDKPIWQQFSSISPSCCAAISASRFHQPPGAHGPAEFLPGDPRTRRPSASSSAWRSAFPWASPRPTGTRNGPIT